MQNGHDHWLYNGQFCAFFKLIFSHTVHLCSSPSLSGHPQQRPPSLMWSQMLATLTVNVITSPSHLRHLSNVATISWQIGWPLLYREIWYTCTLYFMIWRFKRMPGYYGWQTYRLQSHDFPGIQCCTVKPVLRDQCYEKPPVMTDHRCSADLRTHISI